MGDPAKNPETESLVSVRTMEIVVAVLFVLASAIVIYDSVRVGIEWRPAQGPAPGYFPFYIAVGMGIASLFNLFRALRIGHNARTSFVSKAGFKRVTTVLLPLFLFVLGVNFIGLYISAAILICGFMVILGGESLLRAVPVSIGVPLFFYLMFEKWFLAPLPKSPFEQFLGF